MVAVIGLLVLLVAVNGFIFPVPAPLIPINVLLLVQLKVVPVAGIPLNVITGVVELLQTATSVG